MANQGGSVQEVLASALEYMCRFTGWSAAHAFILAGEGDARRMWPSTSGIAIRHMTFRISRRPPRDGLRGRGRTPGNGVGRGEPVWVEEIMSTSNFPRGEVALRSGLRAAFSTPLLIGSEVVAALEFFSPNPMPKDPALLTMLHQAGTQLGRLIERDRATSRLHDSLHDPLTGLPNRTHFLREVDQACREYALDNDKGFCVLFVDLDRFKIVNDSLGHAAGDVLITQVGARLRESIQRGEFTGDGKALLARMGGDEFTILVPGVRSPQDAVAAADSLQALLRNPFQIEGHEVVTSASIGIAMRSSETGSADELVRHADMAMYQAKARGKARCELYDATMQASATRRLDLLSDLQAAVRDQKFELHYQPIVSVADGGIVGAEALVRWRTSPDTLRYPDEFIPAAEETGLIVPRACGSCARPAWRRGGGTPAGTATRCRSA